MADNLPNPTPAWKHYLQDAKGPTAFVVCFYAILLIGFTLILGWPAMLVFLDKFWWAVLLVMAFTINGLVIHGDLPPIG